jgi:hypothetical protein
MDANFPRYEAEAALLEAALIHPALQATIDDVRRKVDCPDGVNPKNFGMVPTQLQADGIIVKVGHAYTERRVAHGRDVSLWRIADVEAARKRLEHLRQLIKEKAERAVDATRSVQKTLF